MVLISFLVLCCSKGKMPTLSNAPPPGPRAVSAKKSSPCKGLAHVARLMKLGRCKNVVVVAGAGISTASGIPDFRLSFFLKSLLIHISPFYFQLCFNSVDHGCKEKLLYLCSQMVVS